MGFWGGVIGEYANRLPIVASCEPISLGEGGTPLIFAKKLSALLGCEVYVKVEAMNPTGSFKDRGMTVAITQALAKKAKAVICASTGNTSASAAAYAKKAGLVCAVLVPEGNIALAKLSQAIAYDASLLQIRGNFDKCLEIVRDLEKNYPVLLVNSINAARIEGQKTAAFEIVDFLGHAPDITALPVGNAGNITAYWQGYLEYSKPYKTLEGSFLSPKINQTPQMWGFQAAGAAPFVAGHPIEKPETIATAIRIGKPASWDKAIAARDESNGLIEAVTDKEILFAQKFLAKEEGIFVEPASAASIAGLLKKHATKFLPPNKCVVAVVTGHGLKDPQIVSAPKNGEKSFLQTVAADVNQVAEALNLA